MHFLAVLPEQFPGQLKRGALRYQLRALKEPATIPEDLATVLDHGLVGGGIDLLDERERHFAWLLEFGQSWNQLTEEARAHALADPWRFLAVVSSISDHGQQLQQNALLHLVFPETFERVMVGEHKERICRTFADLVDDPDTNVDRRLFTLREKLSPRYGAGFDFYDTEALAERWLPELAAPFDRIFLDSDEAEAAFQFLRRTAALLGITDADDRYYSMATFNEGGDLRLFYAEQTVLQICAPGLKADRLVLGLLEPRTPGPAGRGNGGTPRAQAKMRSPSTTCPSPASGRWTRRPAQDIEATLAYLVERYKGWQWERFPKSHHPELRALPFDDDYRRRLLRRGFSFWAVG